MYWAVPRPFTAVTTHNIERWWLKAEKKGRRGKTQLDFWTQFLPDFQICIKFGLHCPQTPLSGRGLNRSKTAWEIWLCMMAATIVNKIWTKLKINAKKQTGFFSLNSIPSIKNFSCIFAFLRPLFAAGFLFWSSLFQFWHSYNNFDYSCFNTLFMSRTDGASSSHFLRALLADTIL